MRLRLLGTAAGGGVPQWNCRCANCEAARQHRIAPMAHCSLAFSPDGSGWYLINATPDVTQQLARWPELHPTAGIRSTPVRGVILTDGELDHVLGLLHLREATRWTLYAPPAIIAMLEDGLRVLPALRRYVDIAVRRLSWEDPLQLDEGASRVTLRLVATGRHLPRYLGSGDEERDGAGAGLQDADVILFDGTFWSDDELPRLGIGPATATSMGHVPVSGPGGSALWLSTLSARAKLYVHINNTNPLLDPASTERAWVRGLGLEVAGDGWEMSV
ncbi:MAG: MBL fold metallo-hydrolase [Bacillati bacterium ANGP1]|uniref:Coenzyme PQQ synthesis protein B n=1 Tax=Candidatus Segetimicrobium genomatis TaxID=2569760 RepID=A0A537LMM9_9BACT|nr:MAG: MBL fold metallo-hydrolase [Terrabacteria group bacterium ANGP1]